ncbi:hypothetical protein IV41_GL000583 [Limosilactobacillus ingluviei]|uniref:Uncharacterized protein n=1 Tax=Limosilactobacillus ingluviei TaxID=148604 RepID=A0A0R2GTM3_9LACO|nr:hypothetical protein IV41_GL000583 [Limosilactobacillus ingluviei]
MGINKKFNDYNLLKTKLNPEFLIHGYPKIICKRCQWFLKILLDRSNREKSWFLLNVGPATFM